MQLLSKSCILSEENDKNIYSKEKRGEGEKNKRSVRTLYIVQNLQVKLTKVLGM